MTTSEELTPLVQVIDKDAVEGALTRLVKGSELGHNKLAAITAVTVENREAVVAELETIKKIHDKITSIREPLTKWLDEKKKQLMSFERETDYKDAKSVYTQKRDLVQAFDQQVLEESRKKEFAAEHGRKINVYKAELKAAVQRQLVDMMAAKKKTTIEGLANWKASLTLENFDAKSAALIAKQPVLAQADFDKCFNTNFAKGNMVTIEQEGLIQNSGHSLPDMKAERERMNLEAHTAYLEELKKEFTYEKYNEEYVREMSIVINEVRAELPTIKDQLTLAKGNAEAETKRIADLKSQAAVAVQAVEATRTEQLQTVSDDKDKNVMEADFISQEQKSDLPAVPVKKVVSFAKGQFIAPFTKIVERVASHPDFPGINKKGKDEHVDAVQWWLTFYQTRCQIEEAGKPLISGVVITEEAKTTIKAKK